MNKKALTEVDIRTKFIAPALEGANGEKCDLMTQTPALTPADQRRSVARVEPLMALGDALETQLAASRATAANLLSALVAELPATA